MRAAVPEPKIAPSLHDPSIPGKICIGGAEILTFDALTGKTHRRMGLRMEMTAHQKLIHQLGGYRAVAEKLSAPLTTVNSWMARGRIPAIRFPAIVELAKREGIQVELAELHRHYEAYL